MTPEMFLMQRHRGITFWRHGGGAPQNALLLTTAGHVIYWGPVWLDQNQIWILRSGSWNHEVVNKQNVESESGF